MAPKTSFWDDDPTEWDALYLATANGGTLVAPGIVKDIKVTRGLKLDEKTGPGVNGSFVVIQGGKLAKVEITLQLWNKNHLERLEKILAELLPNDAKWPPKPRDWLHPVIQLHGLKALLIDELEGPTQPDEKGISTLTLKLLQYKPPPKSSATSKPSSQGLDAVYNPNVYTFGNDAASNLARYDVQAPLLPAPFVKPSSGSLGP